MPNKPRKILLLGGTKEAAERAAELVAQGADVTTSLAGRTREPEPVAGKVRVGGFGGVEGLADYLLQNAINELIDATHPFAIQISANAKAAAERTGVTLTVLTRAPWQRETGDNWHILPSPEAAVDSPPPGATVLLALGSQHIAPFARRKDVHFIIRMIDRPQAPLPFAKHTIVLGKPSSEPDKEASLLKAYGVTHIVCRNSGGPGAYGKIVAARTLGLPVIMIERPTP
ncbi:cobalt-precorrin-6A reductase [Pseudahrensia aquimaris]|uniref:Cobalt-precorrin-6A reductase n=1 Tax=Pseudahrensia aquimaris TaxID=744461 RepID=A0ABW3FIG9_9HYPH